MNERINAVINAAKISRAEFAERVLVSRPFVSELCSGAKKPSDRTIRSICQAFGVNEQWLRTGEGEMFTADRIGPSGQSTEYSVHILTCLPHYHERMTMPVGQDFCQKLAEGECMARPMILDAYSGALREAIRCIKEVHGIK